MVCGPMFATRYFHERKDEVRRRENCTFATRTLAFPYCQPFTNNSARYDVASASSGSANTKDIIASTSSGTDSLNVVTKNPTPGPLDDRDDRLAQDEVSKPGRCHPSRSPKRPPSFKIPRVLSGKLKSYVVNGILVIAAV